LLEWGECVRHDLVLAIGFLGENVGVYVGPSGVYIAISVVVGTVVSEALGGQICTTTRNISKEMKTIENTHHTYLRLH